MADFKQCEFFLLRYVPDVVKGEFVNVGVVLLENGDGGFTDVRFTRDWRRVRCLDPEVDIELLESYEAELRRLLQSRLPEVINYRGPMSRREWLLAQMEQSFSGALELAPMNAVLTESPPAELGKLAQAYLESAARGRRVQAGRRAIFNFMRDAFEQAGVWELMLKNIEVARYTRRGDPLKIDCGYRSNASRMTLKIARRPACTRRPRVVDSKYACASLPNSAVGDSVSTAFIGANSSAPENDCSICASSHSRRDIGPR